LTATLAQPFSDGLLDIAAVRYLVVAGPANGDADGDAGRINAELAALPYLRRVDVGTGGLTVYENQGIRPHLYLTREKESLAHPVPFEEIGSRAVSTGEYRLSLRGLRGQAILNFSEEFHPQWKLRVGRFDPLSALGGGDYFLPDSVHFENAAGFNAFVLSPETIRRFAGPGQYREGPDGSIDADLTLYFGPQSQCLLGGLISAATLLGCLACLLWTCLSRRWRRK
jgi:hypothetical protein